MTQEPFLYLEAGANDPTAIIGNDFNFQLSFTGAVAFSFTGTAVAFALFLYREVFHCVYNKSILFVC